MLRKLTNGACTLTSYMRHIGQGERNILEGVLALKQYFKIEF